VTSTGDEVPAPDERYVRRENRIAVAVTLLVGVAATVKASGLGLGSVKEPGAGLWPAITAVAMALSSLVLLIWPQPSGDEEFFTREARLVVVGAVSLVAYAIVFERLGFELPTVALIVLWLRGIGRESWSSTVTIALGTTVVVYLLFIVALGVSLPHALVI
jgi:putative tricarboxylic transport membrane protein